MKGQEISNKDATDLLKGALMMEELSLGPEKEMEKAKEKEKEKAKELEN